MDGASADRGRAVTENILAHYGVKGMRWGVRKKTSSPAQERDARLKKLRRQMNRLDMDAALLGVSLRGYSAQKIHAKRRKKDPNYDSTGKSWTPEQQAKFDKQVSAHAKRSTIRGGAIAAGILGAVGTIAVSALASNGAGASTLQTARSGVVGIAAIPVKQAYGGVKAVRTADKRTRLLNEISDLEKQNRRSSRAR